MFSVNNRKNLYIISVLTILTLIIICYSHNNNNSSKQQPTISRNFKKYHENVTYFNSPKLNNLLNITLKYHLNNEKLCYKENLTAIIIITSYFGNTETRASIRRTFNNSTKSLKLMITFKWIFLLGDSNTDKYTTQKKINEESTNFKDILQGNFTEAYRNLTYKHLMGLKWVSTYCSNPKYVIKIDDDTVINIYKLHSILESLQQMEKKNFIAGYKLNKMKPIRDISSKWYVKPEEYPFRIYPDFVSGWFYVTTPKVARILTELSEMRPYFWIDDVFITGILRQLSKKIIHLYDISSIFAVNSEFLQCCLADFQKFIDCNFYVGPNGADNKMIEKFNKNYELSCRKSSKNKCTNKRAQLLNETCVAERKMNLGRGNASIKTFNLS